MNRRSAIKAAIAGVAAAVGWKVAKAASISFPPGSWFWGRVESICPTVYLMPNERLDYEVEWNQYGAVYRAVYPKGSAAADVCGHPELPQIGTHDEWGDSPVRKSVIPLTETDWRVEVVWQRGRFCWECEGRTAYEVCHRCGFDPRPGPDGGCPIPPRFNAKLEAMFANRT